MTILIDSNIVLDALLRRDEYNDDARKVMELICFGSCKAMVSASSVTDIYFLMTKSLREATGKTSKELSPIVRSALGSYFCVVDIADTTKDDISSAFSSSVSDFEDSVVASVAERNAVDYIVTRNTKDFKNSFIRAVNPQEAVELLKSISDKQPRRLSLPSEKTLVSEVSTYFTK